MLLLAGLLPEMTLLGPIEVRKYPPRAVGDDVLVGELGVELPWPKRSGQLGLCAEVLCAHTLRRARCVGLDTGGAVCTEPKPRGEMATLCVGVPGLPAVERQRGCALPEGGAIRPRRRRPSATGTRRGRRARGPPGRGPPRRGGVGVHELVIPAATLAEKPSTWPSPRPAKVVSTPRASILSRLITRPRP